MTRHFQAETRKTAANIDGVSKTPPIGKQRAARTPCVQGSTDRNHPVTPPKGGGSERSMWRTTAPKQLGKREQGEISSSSKDGIH